MSLNGMAATVVAEVAPATSTTTHLDIFASVQIEAEVRRILYALATPEYMEAWLQLPETERVECQSEQRSFDRFRIDLFVPEKGKQSIYGSCHLSKPNRVTYLWDRVHMGIQSRSVVEIHLLGRPNRCTIKLKHRGLTDHNDREWHSMMWHRSLAKLRTLMERIEFESTFC
jgi:Activator of Hsp90 ATPase homolog 1-like protein